jgi:hypothetical protein
MAIVETGPLTMAGANSGGGYSGDGADIFLGTSGDLPWSTHASGAALLDLTTPTSPLVLVSDIYAFTVFIVAGGAADSVSFLGLSWEIGGGPLVLNVTQHMTAGDAATVTVHNVQTVPDAIFTIQTAIVVRFG